MFIHISYLLVEHVLSSSVLRTYARDMHLLKAFSFCKCIWVESTCKENNFTSEEEKKKQNKHILHSPIEENKTETKFCFQGEKTDTFSHLARQLNYLVWYIWNTKIEAGEPNDICAQRPDRWWQVPHRWVQDVLSSCCIYCNSLPTHCDTSRGQERVVYLQKICALTGWSVPTVLIRPAGYCQKQQKWEDFCLPYLCKRTSKSAALRVSIWGWLSHKIPWSNWNCF